MPPPARSAGSPVRLAQQQCPGIRGHRSAVERRHHATTIEPFEFELIGDTPCLHRTPHRNQSTLCHKRMISDSWGRCIYLGEISGLLSSVSDSWFNGNSTFNTIIFHNSNTFTHWN